MTQRILLWAGVAIALSLTVAAAAWLYARSTTAQLFGELVDRVETSEPVVALTFDDGPMPGFTDEILAILEREQVHATFFLVGEAIAAYPGETERIVAAGHEVGNHSYSHRRMVLIPYDSVADELQRTDQLIRAAGYTGPIRFRPPYGKKLVNLPRYLAREGVTSITWDVAPDSYGDPAPDRERLVRTTLEQVRPGSIVLLHVMFAVRRNSMDALPDIIRGLKDRGYRFLTVSEMLEYRDPK
ncbi:MAG: polysaccharide deacetylase family protein [Xanthomonadales bacterium]